MPSRVVAMRDVEADFPENMSLQELGLVMDYDDLNAPLALIFGMTFVDMMTSIMEWMRELISEDDTELPYEGGIDDLFNVAFDNSLDAYAHPHHLEGVVAGAAAHAA